MDDIEDVEKKDLMNKEVCNVDDDEETEESTHMKSIKSPSAPSRQEMLEHCLTHFPFRSWCQHCVKGKAKATKHSVSGGADDSSVPIIGLDYAFMRDRKGARVEESGEID